MDEGACLEAVDLCYSALAEPVGMDSLVRFLCRQFSARAGDVVAEAAEMLQDPGVVFVDVRSRAEVAFLGLPTRVNVHIPLYAGAHDARVRRQETHLHA